MTDYLARLALRSLGSGGEIRPRRLSRFEPQGTEPGAMLEEATQNQPAEPRMPSPVHTPSAPASAQLPPTPSAVGIHSASETVTSALVSRQLNPAAGEFDAVRPDSSVLVPEPFAHTSPEAPGPSRLPAEAVTGSAGSDPRLMSHGEPADHAVWPGDVLDADPAAIADTPTVTGNPTVGQALLTTSPPGTADALPPSGEPAAVQILSALTPVAGFPASGSTEPVSETDVAALADTSAVSDEPAVGTALTAVVAGRGQGVTGRSEHMAAGSAPPRPHQPSDRAGAGISATGRVGGGDTSRGGDGHAATPSGASTATHLAARAPDETHATDEGGQERTEPSLARGGTGVESADASAAVVVPLAAPPGATRADRSDGRQEWPAPAGGQPAWRPPEAVAGRGSQSEQVVEIRIGRIEVQVPPAVAAPPPIPAERGSAPPLADYLQQRSQESAL